MPKFRKKPVVVEATQWFPGAIVDGVRVEPGGLGIGPPIAFIRTLEGDLRVSPGDWIVTDVEGKKYPFRPDVFEATYEKVQES